MSSSRRLLQKSYDASVLLPRVLTAVVGIPLLLGVIHLGGLAFAAFVTGIAALSLYEYTLILSIGRRPTQGWLAVASGAALAACEAFDGPTGLALAASVAAALFYEMSRRERSLERLALSLFGAVMFGWMPAHLAQVRDLRPYGERMTFLLFVTVWAMDSAAYFVGRAVGKRKLAPEISPKKTWEGAIAGFIAAFGVVFAFRAGLPEALPLPRALAVAFLIGTTGQLSDLAESLVKRAVGVKDSGALLPGHGGVMDRFDSFILAAPAVYYCLALI